MAPAGRVTFGSDHSAATAGSGALRAHTTYPPTRASTTAITVAAAMSPRRRARRALGSALRASRLSDASCSSIISSESSESPPGEDSGCVIARPMRHCTSPFVMLKMLSNPSSSTMSGCFTRTPAAQTGMYVAAWLKSDRRRTLLASQRRPHTRRFTLHARHLNPSHPSIQPVTPVASKRRRFSRAEPGWRRHFDGAIGPLSKPHPSAMSCDVVGGAERRQVRVIGVATARPLGLVVEIGVECEPVATVTGACAMREDQQQFEPDFGRNPLTRTSRFSPIWAEFIGGLHALSLVHTYDN